MKTTVIAKWNAKDTADEKYVGRVAGTYMHYGNPFTHKAGTLAAVQVGSVREAVDAFRAWLKGEAYQHVEPARRLWILANLRPLKGKKLVCFGCNPCHAGVLAEMADALPED